MYNSTQAHYDQQFIFSCHSAHSSHGKIISALSECGKPITTQVQGAGSVTADHFNAWIPEPIIRAAATSF